MISEDEAKDRLTGLVSRAMKAGATAADALLVEDASVSIGVRLGLLEEVSRSESQDYGLRVMIGQRQAIVSASNWAPAVVDDVVERALAMAALAPEDPYCGLAGAEGLLRGAGPSLDLFDGADPGEAALKQMALAAEDAGRAVSGVSNSEGAGAGHGQALIALATSAGFAGAYRASSFSVSMTAVASAGEAMERDYAYHSVRHLADMDAPDAIGREAGERAVKRLNPAKLGSERLPVLFDPRVAASLIGHLTGAISGSAIARRTSFLLDAMGAQLFKPGVHVRDDPHRIRGLRSKPFDAEGTATAPLDLVADGVLKSWLLDSSSARQLGLKSTGQASRGTSGPPGPGSTNLYMAPGALTPQALMAPIKRGLYVTELIGMGVNGVTGDYSRGAAGFLVEDGELGPAVSEITIASNLKDMFRELTPANDLEFRHGVNAPTLLIEGMMVAGS